MIKNKPELEYFYDSDPTTPELIGFIVEGIPYKVQNIAPNPTHGTMVDPLDIIHFTETMKAEATWHTHPGGPSNLSGDDYSMFKDWPDMDHYIIGCDGIRCYRYDKVKKAVVEK